MVIGQRGAFPSLKSRFHTSVAVAPIARDDAKKKKRRRTHGNKGKVPWNKGIKHSAETRALIKKNTVEALRDPKIRNKMASHPRPHSDEEKSKISISMKKKWAKRLYPVKIRERFHSSWAMAIAEAAKKGGIGQKELKWESTKKNTKIKEKKPERVTKPKLPVREPKKVKIISKMSEKKKEHIAPENLSLKQRLTKIRTAKTAELFKSLNSQTSSWNKLDINLNCVSSTKESSLAEEIKLAKSKRSRSQILLE